MAEKKEKKPERQRAYIGLALLFVLFVAAVMALVKFRLVHPVNLYVVSEPSSSEAVSSLPEEVLAENTKEIFREVLGMGEKEYVPAVSSSPQKSEESADATEKININTANAAELEKLPGIGQALAERIIQYREEEGPFSTIEDIMAVKGIGEKKFEKLREYIVVS